MSMEETKVISYQDQYVYEIMHQAVRRQSLSPGKAASKANSNNPGMFYTLLIKIWILIWVRMSENLASKPILIQLTMPSTAHA